MREGWRHRSCQKREQAKAEHEAEFIRASLGKDKVTRSRVMEFLRANYPSVPVDEQKQFVIAGLLTFRFNDNDEMIDFVRTWPCPIT